MPRKTKKNSSKAKAKKQEKTVHGPGQKPILLVMALVFVLIFATSFWIRWSNPSMERVMHSAEQPQMGAGGAMDMEGVRAMMEGLEAQLAENPEDIDALFQMANINMMRKDNLKVEEYLNRIEPLIQERPDMLMEVASAWFEIGQYEKAVNNLERIIFLEPGNMHAQFNMGLVLKYSLGREEEAAEYFKVVAGPGHGHDDLRKDAKGELGL